MLIAFTSQNKQAGKDTAAQFVCEWCEEHGIRYERRAFADKMKVYAAEILGIIETTGDSAKDYNSEEIIAKIDAIKLHGSVEWHTTLDLIGGIITGREFIINIAEGLRTLINPNIWTTLCLDDLIGSHKGTIVAITDLSYDHEAEAVRSLEGKVICIENDHVSESRLRPGLGLSYRNIDISVSNHGHIDNFKDSIRYVVNKLWTQEYITIHG